MFSLENKRFSIKIDIHTESDLEDVLQTYLNSNAHNAELFDSLQRAILTAVMKDKGADRDLIQGAWNRINLWAKKAPPPSTTDYPLPTAGVKAPVTPKKSAPTTVTAKIYSLRVTEAVKAWISVMKEVCLASGTQVADIDWAEVSVNLLMLTDFRDEDGFVTLSLEAPSLVDTSKVATALLRLKQGPGLKGLLVKIQMKVDPGKEENASGNIYGAFSELMDLFFSLVQSLDLPESRISAPRKYKGFTEPKTVPGTRIDPKALWQQDIDRTEIVNGIKFYVEVKADVHTAVQKHRPGQQQDSGDTIQFKQLLTGGVSEDQKNGTSQQLLRILAVVNQREGKVTTKHSLTIHERQPAVSILKPAGWLELFTSGTARLYVRLGFHLFINGVRFTPLELDQVATVVNQGIISWCENKATEDANPTPSASATRVIQTWDSLQYNKKKHYRGLFFKTYETKFAPPDKWKEGLMASTDPVAIVEGLGKLWLTVVS